jgi:hypothetical protein
MALSPDGRYLFSWTDRLQVHRERLPPGTIAYDDASFEEQVIAVFDTVNQRFLDQLITATFGNPFYYDLLGSRDSNHVDILEVYPGVRLLRWSIEPHATREPQTVADLRLDDSSSVQQLGARLIEDPVHRRRLLIRGDGVVVEVRDGLKQIGAVSAAIAPRLMWWPSISGDGKLLVIPTGSDRIGDRVLPGFPPGFYIDQIDTYTVADLKRVRSLHLQRPFCQVRPNQNGTELYALPAGGRSMLILDAATLSLKREYVLDPPICDFTVIPK